MNIINSIKALFVKPDKPEPSKYRLVPDGYGTYTLQVLIHCSVFGHWYKPERILVTEAQADESIAALERGTKYYIKDTAQTKTGE